MFVPLHDENSLRSISFQYVTVGLIVLNVLVFLIEQAGMEESAIAGFALVPFELLGPTPAASGAEDVGAASQLVPEPLTLLTYMFFHVSWLHLIGNMLFLWVFGDNVEDSMGHLRFLAFYLLCGIIAGLVHAMIVNGASSGLSVEAAAASTEADQYLASQSPLIGASGAVAGVIAAYLMLHPNVRVWVLAFRIFPLRIYAWVALGLWVLMQVVMVFIPQAGPVAWWAHIGGLVAGGVLIVFFRRRDVPLFS
jgi:membrane associated rhomboid family serine protease